MSDFETFPQNGIENENTPEKNNPYSLEFYVTDHSPDYPDTGEPEKLEELYSDIRKDGISSVRYDWHWRNVEPQEGKFSQDHLNRYQNAKEIMSDVGLEAPTIILSNPPEWAKDLYKTDKEKFYEEYRKYVETIKERLVAAKGQKVSRVQILNELNTTVYTPVAVQDLPRLCEITRAVFQEYNPDIKLVGSIVASNTVKLAGQPMETFLPKLKEIKDSFDVIAVDYYPGLWHLPVGESPSKRPKELFKYLVKQTELLKETFTEIATWDKEYELGEVGLPSKKLWGGEKGQRYFYDAFFQAFKHMLVDLQTQGIKLPSRVGLYEAIDEQPRTTIGKIIKKTTPFPEYDLGARKSDGKRKLILQGSPHLPEDQRMEGSQLKKIISYLRAPMEKSK